MQRIALAQLVAGSSFIGLVLEGVLAALGMTSIPAFVIVGAISALTAGILMNTQAGKDFVNFLIDDIAKPLIDSIESKLQSFFSLFDSNPSKYELVSNPTLESNDYKSLIELLLDPNSNALDIDTLLHTFPNYLAYPTHTTADSTKSPSLSNITDSIPMCIDALCLNHKNEPLANKEIYVYSPNFTSFVDKARSDDNGYIVFNNACVSSKMTNSDLYFVLNRYGLDEEQKDFHTKISPSKTIQPKDKKARKLTNQTLVFNKHIPKTIKANDSIKPNIKVISIECKDIKYAHNNTNTQVKAKSNTPNNITMNNTSIKSHHTNNTIESITLKAHYALRDSQRQYIQGDETTYTQDSIQRHKHKTKWGYIVFDKDEDIESTLREMTASTPLYKSKRFQELEGITGEIVSIPFKEEWQDKQIRFFAYLWRAHKDVGVDVEFEESIPPNVIRIETEDDSGEYIEIEFDENDTLKDINNNNDELNDLLHQAKDILYELSPFSSAELAYNNFTAGEYKDALIDAITILPMAKAFKAKTIANKIKNIISKDKRKEDVRIAKPKPKSLSRQEVLEIVSGLKKALNPKGKPRTRIYLVNSKEELTALWERLTKNFKSEHIETSEKGTRIIRTLDDDTEITLRSYSSKKSGNTPTIDTKINGKDYKIHMGN